MKKILLGLCLSSPLLAQENPLKISGYAEIYYQKDLLNATDGTRPSYIYSHHRNNEVNLNLGLLKASYSSAGVRGNLGLAAGTYMQANYAGEDMKVVYEANVGLKLSKKHELWLDAGIMPSHLGFESALGMDNWTVSRSLFAENSPYFETGAKLSYTSKGERWYLSLLALNGWQRIYQLPGTHSPALGHQVTFKPSARWTLNSGSYVGNDSLKRYFHNFYLIHQLNSKWAVTAGVDIGAEQHQNAYAWWHTPVVLIKYAPQDKLSFTARAEYYQDKQGIITGIPGFKTQGYSLNLDYSLFPKAAWRTEVRRLQQNADLTILTALALRF